MATDELIRPCVRNVSEHVEGAFIYRVDEVDVTSCE